jgi:hypothetical protein
MKVTRQYGLLHNVMTVVKNLTGSSGQNAMNQFQPARIAFKSVANQQNNQFS